jgi:hypothetical protein
MLLTIFPAIVAKELNGNAETATKELTRSGGAAAAAAVQPGALAHRCTRCVLAKTAVFWFFWVF